MYSEQVFPRGKRQGRVHVVASWRSPGRRHYDSANSSLYGEVSYSTVGMCCVDPNFFPAHVTGLRGVDIYFG